jgi:UDP-GlcNAc:undecaprenyl-phosphate GlcNAc-1-phosphate transferase
MAVWTFIAVFATALGATVALTPVSIWLGKRLDIVDRPGGRRKHSGNVVRIGGLAFFPALALAALLPLALGVPRQDPLELTRLIGVLAGIGVIWVMGLLDDRYKLKPGWQFAGMLLAGIVAILFKVFIELFNSPFTGAQVKVDWYLMVPITLIWLVSMTETVNMLDGVDGLASGVTAIASLVLFIHMLRLGQYSVSLLPLALLGVCLGFLVFNFYPAKIFLGGGALVLGYALGALSIVAGAKVATALLVLWVPIVDWLWQVYSRWKRGQPISLGDRGHLQFRLQDMGWSAPRIALLYYSVTAVLGAVALTSSSRGLKLAVLLTLAAIVLIGLYLLARKMGDRTPTGT